MKPTRAAYTCERILTLSLTNLYNTRPQWLTDTHAALDAAVAAAYGWDAGISNENAIRELLAFNLIEKHHRLCENSATAG